MRSMFIFSLLQLLLFAQTPKLFLLNTYNDESNLTGWFMSEKLDGVRAFWDGKKLISRSGRVFNTTQSFIQGFPSFALDGELWSRRGEFEHIVSIVNSMDADERWNELQFNVFEVPKQEGNLRERLNVIQAYLRLNKAQHIKVVEQIRVINSEHVQSFYKEVTQNGGEGIVLRDPNQSYYTGRTDASLKLKPYLDAECKVLSIVEGKGKFSGSMGAIECDYGGVKIRVGSGFTNKERANPPKVGETISFKYYGLTHLGNPKYPVFLRVRLDAKLNEMQ